MKMRRIKEEWMKKENKEQKKTFLSLPSYPSHSSCPCLPSFPWRKTRSSLISYKTICIYYNSVQESFDNCIEIFDTLEELITLYIYSLLYTPGSTVYRKRRGRSTRHFLNGGKGEGFCSSLSQWSKRRRGLCSSLSQWRKRRRGVLVFTFSIKGKSTGVPLFTSWTKEMA